MIIATKGGIIRGMPYNSSKSHLIAACEASLKRLQIDVIDLYQIHRPDMLAHPAEIADHLARTEVKMLVVACNSIEVSAIEDVARAHGLPVTTVGIHGFRLFRLRRALQSLLHRSEIGRAHV